MRNLLLVILLFVNSVGFCQNITTNQADCAYAIVFQDSISGALEIPKGHGKKLEIFGHDIKNPHFFTEEHNTLWIKLVFTKDTRFTFEINPLNANDDYDFSIFKITSPDFCDSIATNKILPVRSNLCQRKLRENSITGLREGYENIYAAAGNSPSFSAPLDVVKDEAYYLVLDGPYGFISGFEIELKYDEPIVKSEVVEKDDPTPLKVEKLPPRIYLNIVNDSGEQVPNPQVEIRGTKKQDATYKDSSQRYVISPARKLNSYFFTITAKGYKQTQFDYFHRTLKDTTLSFVVEKLKVGTKLKFENISFASNKAEILPSSDEDLKNLTLFLIENSNINVEIGGNVNGIGNKNKGIYKSLSKDRAKAVYDYLILQKIDKNRLSYEGYGNANLIYTNPATEKQNQANRRVEIKVTSIQ